MHGGRAAEAAVIKGLIDAAMRPKSFERLGRSRWLAPSSEILWVIEADRGASWRPWSVELGAIVRGWGPEVESPHASDGHFVQEYVHLTSALPEAAEGTRFDDHASYFSNAFDHEALGMDVAQRRAAMVFMADELARFCGAHSTLDDLALLVRSGRAGGFVHSLLREYATNE